MKYFTNLDKTIGFVVSTTIIIATLALGSQPRACKGASQERSSGVEFHALESIGECEGMNPHTPKGAPTLGVGVLVDFWIFRKQL